MVKGVRLRHWRFMPSGFAAAALSVMIIAAFLLGAGGARMIVKGKATRKSVLMIVAALVLIGNVLIWTL
ncbi:MAG: hypothetical protein H0W74_07410 [Sphingosinicella sp.]|nr:hypothetical protein [Sphingosinicella sp.]